MEKLSVEFYIEKELSHKLYNNIRERKISFPQYVIELINHDLESEIKLNNDFYYNVKQSEIYTHKREKIDLTKLENSFLLLLLKNKNKISSIDLIKSMVWEDDSIPIQSLRNIVRQIRNKTTYTLIETIPNKGYRIKTHSN